MSIKILACSGAANRTAGIAVLYSKALKNDLQGLLGALTLGVDSSEKIGEERDADLDNSDCVTVMIQLNAKDCVCHFVTNRDVALKAINDYKLTSITSE